MIHPSVDRRSRRGYSTWLCGLALIALFGLASGGASGQTATEPAATAPAPADQTWAVHGQATVTDQGNLAFNSPYVGPNSLDPVAHGRETSDVTLYLGFRPWAGAEAWVDGEIDQGFGLTDTLGLAGFSSGEALKVGKAMPYAKLPRLFLRQTIDLGGESQTVDADLNQLAGSHTANRIVITIGKFGVTDIFDNNDFAHDARHDFLNWSVIDAGTFDYAADAWGFTYGAVVEGYFGRWTARVGLFDLSVVPNATSLERDFSQFQIVSELEERHKLWGQDGKVAITGFISRGRMGSFADALRLSAETGQPADIAAVRHYQGRPGLSLDVQQAVSDTVGVFARAGWADGTKEPYEYTDIDRTISAGVSLKGAAWKRPADVVGVALVGNAISRLHEAFLNDGGLGILVGDGKLPHPGAEKILETYYDIPIRKIANLTLDYQFVDDPAYNRDRGPVSILAVRLHAQF